MSQPAAPSEGVHPLDQTLAFTAVGDDPNVVTAQTPAEYNNMVGPWGGATAAAILGAIAAHPDVHGYPLALTINFAGPLTLEPYQIAAIPVRTNRTNQHWQVTLTQDDAVTTTATAVFGVRRDTWGDTEAVMPAVDGPESTDRVTFPDFISWATNFEMRFTSGEVPVAQTAPSSDSITTMWLRDTRGRALDYPALAAYTDTFYPRVFRRAGNYLPAGTISLTTYFHATPDEIAEQADDFVLATVRGQRFGHGHFDHNGEIWSRSGQLLATTHQLVYYKGI